MIRAIIFDFDGVILESAEIKTDAFRTLFSWCQPEQREAIIRYHQENMGVSRYHKFRYFYENIIQMPVSEEEIKRLGERFTEVVYERILSCPFVPGAEAFMQQSHRDHLLFIASGTPEMELKNIVKARQIDKYFTEVHGTPRSKDEIVRDIMLRFHLSPEEVVFIGDALSDQRAASLTNVHFIARQTNENLDLFDVNTCKVRSLLEINLTYLS